MMLKGGERIEKENIKEKIFVSLIGNIPSINEFASIMREIQNRRNLIFIIGGKETRLTKLWIKIFKSKGINIFNRKEIDTNNINCDNYNFIVEITVNNPDKLHINNLTRMVDYD